MALLTAACAALSLGPPTSRMADCRAFTFPSSRPISFSPERRAEATCFGCGVDRMVVRRGLVCGEWHDGIDHGIQHLMSISMHPFFHPNIRADSLTSSFSASSSARRCVASAVSAHCGLRVSICLLFVLWRGVEVEEGSEPLIQRRKVGSHMIHQIITTALTHNYKISNSGIVTHLGRQLCALSREAFDLHLQLGYRRLLIVHHCMCVCVRV